MSGFDASWLALREPVDHRSRSETLTAALEAWLASRVPDTRRLVDLGCGAGSNVRYLVPRLEGRQHWTCVDDDAALLEDVARIRFAGVALEARRLDLARDLATIPHADDAAPHVLTGAALLDLVSDAWIEAMVALARRCRAAVLFALTVDGRLEASPAHAEDDGIREAFGAHQHRDKGFGPALGPDAPSKVAAALGAAGYVIQRASSDWRLDARVPGDAALLEPLLEGIAAAAIEQVPSAKARIVKWLEARRRQCADGTLRFVVGHEDTLGLPSEDADELRDVDA